MSVFYNQDLSGLQDHEFQVRHPDSPALLYQLRLGDEKLQVTDYYSIPFRREFKGAKACRKSEGSSNFNS